MSWESRYDQWKTACCGNYPNCHPCPYDTDDEEFDEDEDYDEDDADYEEQLLKQMEED